LPVVETNQESSHNMELHTLKSAPGSRKKRKRVGRGHGSGSGKTSGKGHKGQQARSGYSRRAGFEGGQNPLHRRLPRRGFNHESRWPMAIVNLDRLEEFYEDGAEINGEVLVKRGHASDLRGGIKILGRGDLSKKLHLSVQAISASAREKIEAAGGSVQIVPAKGEAAEAKAAAPAKAAAATPAKAEKAEEKPQPEKPETDSSEA